MKLTLLLSVTVLAALPVVLIANIEADAPALTLLLCLIAGVAVSSAVYQRLVPDSTTASTSRRPAVVVASAALAYAVIASFIAINHHHNFGTTLFDLSIYDNVFYQTVHGRLLGTTLIAGGYHTAAHFDPILVLLAPFYLIYPAAESLLVLQSFWLASTAIPVYLLSARVLGRAWPAAAIAVTVPLHPALHGANFYDFHSLTLIAPLLVWAVYFAERRSPRAYWIVVALLLLTREDVPLIMCFVAAFVWMRGQRRLGLVTAGVSLLYFAAVQLFIMTSAGDDAHSYTYYYSDMVPEGSGAAAMLWTVIKDPIFTIKHVLSSPKRVFIATIMVPVLFTPLLTGRYLTLLVYGFAVILLSSRSALYSVHFQYPAMIFPFVYVLAPFGLQALADSGWAQRRGLDSQRLVSSLAIGILVAACLVTMKYGALVPNSTFRAGFGELQPVMTDESRARYDWLKTARAQIPEDASVAASRHMGPQVSNRFVIHRFPRNGWGSDYVLVDRDELKSWEVENLESITATGSYTTIASYEDRYFLLKRDHTIPLPERIKR